MSILLARIDDRFIHGQVTVGWCTALRPERIILCNDRIAADPWQSRVYASSVPPNLEALVLSIEETRDLLCPDSAQRPAPRTILLMGSPADTLELRRCGLVLDEVNVGGMHYVSGKKEVLEYIYVDQRDVGAFRELLAAGTRLKVQTVPGAPEYRIDEKLLAAVSETF